MCLGFFSLLVSIFPPEGTIFHLSVCLLKGKNWYETVHLCMFLISFLISLPLALFLIKGRNTPGKPMREVSETQVHGHGFCLSHPAFYVQCLYKTCVRARACVYYNCVIL